MPFHEYILECRLDSNVEMKKTSKFTAQVQQCRKMTPVGDYTFAVRDNLSEGSLLTSAGSRPTKLHKVMI